MSEKRFVVSGLLLCEKPMLITATKCDTVERNTRLEVDGIEQGFDEESGVRQSNGMAFCHIKIADGRAGYVQTYSLTDQRRRLIWKKPQPNANARVSRALV